jgi:hypothetical protein
MSIATRVLFAVVLTVTAAGAQEICGSNAECKDERVCTQGRCLAPAPPPPPAGDTQMDAPAPAPETTTVQPTPTPAPAPVRGVQTGGATVVRQPQAAAHHNGFFFRPDLGIGYLSTNANSFGQSATLSGAAGSFGLAFGGAIDHHNILALHIWDLAAAKTTISVNTPGGSSNVELGATIAVFGPEYTYYSNDNLYFSISPGLSQLSFDGDNGNTHKTDPGFGLRAALGKEWWVSDSWGMGLAGQFSFSTNQDTGNNAPTWITWGLSLAFSATYN